MTRIRLKPKRIIDPEWVKKHKEDIYKEMEKKEFLCNNSFSAKEYFPEKYFKELKDSDLQWIMITHPPNTPILVPYASIWLAKLVSATSTYKGVYRKLFAIQTPYGELRITMNECNIIDIRKYLEFIGNDLQLKFLSESELNNRIFAQINYMRTRGISKETAYSMLLGEIKDPNFCYLVFHVNYQKLFSKNSNFILEDVDEK